MNLEDTTSATAVASRFPTSPDTAICRPEDRELSGRKGDCTHHTQTAGEGEQFVSPVFLARIIDEASRQGVEARPMFRGLGIETADLERLGSLASRCEAITVVRRSIPLLNIADRGLEIGMRSSVTERGTLALGMLSAPTLGEALRLAARFSQAAGHLLDVRQVVSGDAFQLIATPFNEDQDVSGFLTDVTFAAAAVLRRQLTGRGQVTVTADLQPTNEHQAVLKCAVSDTGTVLADTGMNPALLEVELTESMLIDDSEFIMSVLKDLKLLGVRIAVDDFGTGYSSLSYLKRFNLDTLKIDRSFVSDLPKSAEDSAIAVAVISLGRSLGLKVVAEGVETFEQEQFLRERGCDLMQGFGLGKPMQSSTFVEWFSTRESRSVMAEAMSTG